VSINSAPDPSYNPAVDKSLYRQFGPENHFPAKQYNKLFLQKSLGLAMDSSAPVFFWPSRLDGVRRGCHLLAEILREILSRYQAKNLQVVFIGDGEFQGQLKEIVTTHHLEKRVGITNFNDKLSRLAYAGSDFILKPSLFEPCGVSQMIGPIYGSLPVARDTGGIHDTIDHMDIEKNTGNGFLFKTFDANGLLWGIEQAMQFYNLPEDVKAQQIERIMKQSPETFNHAIAASRYIKLYEKMLQRPLINNT
jgi:starch synthase/alpha-amylase